MARKHSADEVRQNDDRPPILILRSFADIAEVRIKKGKMRLINTFAIPAPQKVSTH